MILHVCVMTILLSTMAHWVQCTSSTTASDQEHKLDIQQTHHLAQNSNQREPAVPRRGLAMSFSTDWLRLRTPVCVPRGRLVGLEPKPYWETNYIWSWEVSTFLLNNPDTVSGKCTPQCSALCPHTPCMSDYDVEGENCLCDPDRRQPITCPVNAVCNTTTDQCECLPGFRRNVVTGECQDIDECTSPTTTNKYNNICGPQATCTNTLGSYMCSCNVGYEKRNMTTICTDIDECAPGYMNGCSHHATCSNTAGSYTCQCNLPYRGDGRRCDSALVGGGGSTP